MKKLVLGSFAAIAVAASGPAGAADVTPIYKATPVVQSGGWYLWADGEWASVNLPGVGLGPHLVVSDPAAGFPDAGKAVDRFSTRVQGWGARGAIGYILPQGSYSPAWGSNLRFELGGSFLGAKGTQGAGSTVTTFDVGQFTLAGTGAVAFLCVGAFACTTNASLQTDYQAWQIFGKLASDTNI